MINLIKKTSFTVKSPELEQLNGTISKLKLFSTTQKGNKHISKACILDLPHLRSVFFWYYSNNFSDQRIDNLEKTQIRLLERLNK